MKAWLWVLIGAATLELALLAIALLFVLMAAVFGAAALVGWLSA